MSKYKYADYCNDKKCCKCCVPDCNKIGCLIEDALYNVSGARIAIEAIFDYKSHCKNIEVLYAFYEDAKKHMEKLSEQLELLANYYDDDCFYCGYEAAFMIQRALRDVELAYIHLKDTKELVDKYGCECVLCEGYALVTVAFERIAACEVLVRAVAKGFKH